MESCGKVTVETKADEVKYMLQKHYTARGEQLTAAPWQVYPRPQLRRDSYINLNGDWEFTPDGANYDRTIRVPFCPESLLSGIGEHFPEGSTLCYRRSFALPANFNRGRVLLHIGAADQQAELLITACPLCLYNLTKNSASETKLPVVYFTELLAEALGVKE